ncbi:MAG TPA: host attachment protein [Kofleriaceae bacterium]|jgi:protein required for attachment to host cells|nr:host attachment protein [Kofleriaceae bacterium]
MKRACIAIVDGSSARLYLYKDGDGEQPSLTELKDLTNPGRRARDEALFSETKPGVRAQSGGRGSTDDHRDAHRASWDADFAQLVIDELDAIARDQKLAHVILVASSKMLGNLRRVDVQLRKHGIAVDEIERDLARFTLPQIHDHLAAMHVIEPRARAAFARR